MEFGSFMEFHTREGHNQLEAFNESFDHIELAESLGLDIIWLSESHFNPGRSVLSAPLITAAAISGRTERIKIGTAVQILPLGNPLRIAEEVATLDHVSNGRFEFGIGRSGLPGAYEGYNMSYGESRERFFESLEIIVNAFTEDQFSYSGKYHSYENVCLTPKPLQNPYPPMRVAATTSETFPVLGKMEMPIFVGLRGLSLVDVKEQVDSYTSSMNQVGKSVPNVHLRVPIHVAKTTEEAMSNAEESFMKQFRRLGNQLGNSVSKETADSSNERSDRSQRLSEIEWTDIQGEKVAVGDPETVVQQLKKMKASLNLSGFALEFNAGEIIPAGKVKDSLTLFCKEVMPALS
jgi:alkanesulfonate monooxygenase SsuD/methylene tetrahydromethanopterin reductase-like flavin-dependent oxidoreductase (luciferase family)